MDSDPLLYPPPLSRQKVEVMKNGIGCSGDERKCGKERRVDLGSEDEWDCDFLTKSGETAPNIRMST